MGAQLRVYRRRISAVQSTKKITKAMELIAASRIVKAQQRVGSRRPTREAITETVTIVASSSSTEHVLTTERENPGRVAVLVITSDRGLAGAYSSTALRAAEQLIGPAARRGHGPGAVRRRAQGCRLLPLPQPRDGGELDRLLRAAAVRERQGDRRHADRRLPGRVRRGRHRRDPPGLHRVRHLDVPSGRRRCACCRWSSRRPTTTRGRCRSTSSSRRAEGVLDALLPRYLESRIWNALLQSAAAESARRRRAMKSASDNADELIKSLVAGRQRGPPGRDHAGNHGDRRWRRGTVRGLRMSRPSAPEVRAL